MLRGAVAGRYAEALFELASQEKILPRYKSMVDRIEEELKGIEKVIAENPDLQKLFYHPQITPADKKEILNKIFGGKVSRLTANFLALLVDRRREAFFRDIVAEYVRLANASRNIAEAKVTSAVELTVEEKSRLNDVLARLTGKKVRATYAIDPSLIGGVVVRIGDKIIDGSIKTRLSTLKERLLAIS